MSRDLYGRLQAQRGDVPVEMGQINTFETFQRETEDVEANMNLVRQRIDELDGLQKRALNAISDAETGELERHLDRLTSDTNALNSDISNQLKRMQQDIARLPQDAETQMRRNLHGAQTRKFMALLTEYQNAQKRNRDACRDRFVRQYRIVNPNATDEEIQQKLQDTSSQQLFSSQLLDSTRNQRARLALQQAEDRHRDVERIGRSIMEVNQLFLDLQRMVDQQGEVLDRIEDNVNAAVVHVETANQDLGKAVDSARASRRKRWCIFILIIIILIVVVVVVLVEVLPGINAASKASGSQ